MDERERMIKLIQEAVGGCARYWAALIADKLIANNIGTIKKTPIESLGLSVRTYNALKRARVDSVEELRTWDMALLAKIRGLGPTLIAEIKEKLDGGVGDAETDAALST